MVAMNPHRLKFWALLVVIVIFVGYLSMSLAASNFRASHRDEPYVYGVSFSAKYARGLGIDPQQAFIDLLDEQNFATVRLMSYWDEVEPVDNAYSFAELDWQMEQAQRAGTDVSLAIGLRQPRWPECHWPGWVNRDDYEQQLLSFVETVVKRYNQHPALASYQLENEIANRSYGDCPEFEQNLLGREYTLVKNLDQKHPVIINASNQSGIPIRYPLGDEVGLSVYKKAHFDLFGRTWGWSFWYIPASWHSLRAGLIEAGGRPVFIHELQAEPWGPEDTANLSLVEQAETMDVEQLKKNVEFARKTGIREIHLWGAEWWYWRRVKFNDHSLWQTVQSITQQR